MKFPETKIGETVTKAEDWLSKGIGKLKMLPSEESGTGSTLESAANVAEKVVELAEKHWPKPEELAKTPPKIPHPPPIRPRMSMRKGGK
jgi:hypothetical protein